MTRPNIIIVMHNITMMMNSVRPDWVRVVSDLIKAGYTQGELADICGVGQSAISQILRKVTCEPRYSTGAALLRLHSAAQSSGGRRPGAQ